MDAPLLSIRGLTKRYGDFTALDDANLEVEAGEIFALLGPNGAGKTTLIGVRDRFDCALRWRDPRRRVRRTPGRAG